MPYYFASLEAGLWCGGCNWQHMTPEKQREVKKDLVRETLHRLGRTPECPAIDWLYTEKCLRYRNIAQFVFGCQAAETIAGHYAPGSHDIVPIEDCLIQSPAAIRILTTVRHILPELGMQPYERQYDRGWLKHLLVRSNEEGKVLITFITRDARFPRREQLIRIMTE